VDNECHYSSFSAAIALYDVNEATGIIGWGDVTSQMLKIAPKILFQSHHMRSDALTDMIELARSRVPVDTGLLLGGIEGEVFDDYAEFRASAVRISANGQESADYAHFVEFGTAPGVRGSSVYITERAGLFSLPGDATSAFPTGPTGMRQRQQYRTHPGTPAQPFFMTRL